MPISEGSSEDITEISKRFDANNGTWITTSMLSDSSITGQTYYIDNTAEITKTLYYASFKLLDDLSLVGNWVGSGDEDSTAVNSGGWLDETNDVLRVTYTKSTGTATITDATTNYGDISAYIGSGCDQGYAMLIMKCSDFSNVTALQLKIGSSNANYRHLTLNGNLTSNSWTANDKFFGLIFDLSAGTDQGTPDGTAIDYIQLNWTVAAGTSQTIDIKDLYICGAEYATVTNETANKVAGSDFNFVRRQRLVFTSESKTIDYEYCFESENESVIKEIIEGGY
jgi:hypothetical protein